MGSMKDLLGDTPYPDLEGARAAKRVALQQVAANAAGFMGDAAKAFPRLFRDGELLIGEEIRIRYEQASIRPHHHNAWGAFISQLIRRGQLRKTGAYRAMAGPKSHARMTAEFRVCLG